MGSDGDYTVRVSGSDGSLDMRAVSVGLISETLAEIQSGLSEGEAVIVGTDTERTGTSGEDEAAAGPGGFGGLGALGGLAGGTPPQGFIRRDQQP
jgi:hypothetical protein